MALTLAFTATAFNDSDLTIYTFSAVAIGAAAADRVVVVAAHSEEGGELVSMTVGGIPATVAISAGEDAEFAVVAYAAVPTGTTVDIVVTWTSQARRSMVGAWRLTGANATPTATDSSTSTPSTGESLSVNIPANAAAVAAHTSNQSRPGLNWVGAVGRYQDATSLSEFQGADTQPIGSVRTGHVISTSYASLSLGAALVSAVWDQALLVVDAKVGYTKLVPSAPNPL